MDGQGSCLYRTHGPVGETDDMGVNRQHIFRVMCARKKIQQGNGMERLERCRWGQGGGKLL